MDKMEPERPEEETPLLERQGPEEDNKGFQETSFIQQERQDQFDWDEIHSSNPVMFEEVDMRNDPQKFLEQKGK